ncbi:DNA-processing protein DprA [Agromyces bauzanensis]|uniref:DNA processing protein DprA n=1 Tax=Agromyces bauzanensis TaxID=1308924 RepID=A0A917PHT0_9MICO|nr:DNA-processing protein DprA [Agromyces bauzanensis]GGJ79450.1 DNA processing protein DprA [Agromyces bauzanensis]
MNVVERSAKQSEAEFAAVRRGVVDTEPGDLDAFARAVLGLVAEPGDGVLGRVIAAIGAVRTAELLLERVTGETLSGAVAGARGDLDEREAATGLDRWLPRLDHAAFVRSLGQAARVGAGFVVPGDRAWPAQLDELGAHSPIGLWVRGRRDALARDIRSISLVGARAATGYGEHVTMEASAGLVDRGFTIVSGGAYGIDGMAHRAALASDGVTVAFLAGGVDRFYPLGHEALLGRIAETGAVVSELPCGAAPTKWRFLQRNRLIAAAADATVVLEAGMRSGSINTAGHAAELGRPLGAVPGPVTSPASAGCHRLFREYDAVCVVDAEQMAELAGGGVPVRARGDVRPSGAKRRGGATEVDQDDAALSPDVLRVTDALSTRSPRSIDEIARRSGMSVLEVMGVLGPLELHGVALRHADGWLRRRVRG